MMEFIGIVSSILWGISMVPELIRTIKNKKCFIGNGLLATTLFASIGSIIYTVNIHSYPLLANYVANLIILVVILVYKIKYK